MLSLLLWAPLAFGLLCLVVPRGAARWVGLAGSLATLALAAALALDFDSSTPC